MKFLESLKIEVRSIQKNCETQHVGTIVKNFDRKILLKCRKIQMLENFVATESSSNKEIFFQQTDVKFSPCEPFSHFCVVCNFRLRQLTFLTA